MIFSSEGAGKNMLIIFFYISSWSKSCAFTLTVTSTKLLASSLLNCKSIMHILMNVSMNRETVASILKLFTSGIWSALVYFAPENYIYD